jgi:ABC-type dipeptide/oligopeptide/nickel transport system permease component
LVSQSGSNTLIRTRNIILHWDFGDSFEYCRPVADLIGP